MTSFSKNIQRLKNTEALNKQRQWTNAENVAKWESDAATKQAEALSGFSKLLKDEIYNWKREDMKKKRLEGKRFRQDENIKTSQKMADLVEDRNKAKLLDTGYQGIKGGMLANGSPYYEADRITHLSPWQQVGYNEEKLREFKESLDDKLENRMANSNMEINVAGETFTPAEVHDNPALLPVKEAAAHVLANEIADNAGIYGYSDEMLELAGVQDKIQESKDKVLGKYRERYNIDASIKTREKAIREYERSEKTPEDFARLLLITSNTVDKKNKLLGRSGGWDEAMAYLKTKGIQANNPNYGDKVGKQIIPKEICKQLGIDEGTTFEEHWGPRFSTLRSDIKKGVKSSADVDDGYIKAQGTIWDNRFRDEAAKGEIPPERLRWYKDQYAMATGGMSSEIMKSYDTQFERNYRDDKKWLEERKGYNGGFILPNDLWGLHPKLIGEHMEKAKENEEKLIGEGSEHYETTEKLVDGILLSGLKDLDKRTAKRESIQFQLTKETVMEDFQKKYMSYRKDMGHEAALDKALYDPKHGVLTALTTKNDKGQSVYYTTLASKLDEGRKANLKQVEVSENVQTGRQFANANGGDGRILGQKPIPGSEEYLEEAKQSLEAGIIPPPQHVMDYYSRLSSSYSGIWGRSGVKLLDAQLKLSGHPGIWPDRDPWRLQEEANNAKEEPETNLNQGLNSSEDQAMSLRNNSSEYMSIATALRKPTYGGTITSYYAAQELNNKFNGNSQISVYNSPDLVPDYMLT